MCIYPLTLSYIYIMLGLISSWRNKHTGKVTYVLYGDLKSPLNQLDIHQIPITGAKLLVGLVSHNYLLSPSFLPISPFFLSLLLFLLALPPPSSFSFLPFSLSLSPSPLPLSFLSPSLLSPSPPPPISPYSFPSVPSH